METAMLTILAGAIIGTVLCIWLVVRGVRWLVDQWSNGEGWQ